MSERETEEAAYTRANSWAQLQETLEKARAEARTLTQQRNVLSGKFLKSTPKSDFVQKIGH